MGAALPTTPQARLSKTESKRSSGSIRLGLVLLALTALSVYRLVVYRDKVTQYFVSTVAPNPSPPQKEPEMTKKTEEKVKVTDLSPPQKKSNITKSLAEKVKVSKPSPTEKEAGNTIESEGKHEKDVVSASVADTKSDDSANFTRGAVPASASVPTSAPTSNLSPNPDRVFWCGWDVLFGDSDFNLAKVLFPGVPAQLFEIQKVVTGPNDVLLMTVGGGGGYCPSGEGNPNMEDAFPGKIMYIDGESAGPSPAHERVYSLGPLADSNNTIRSYYGAMILGVAKPDTQQKIFDPNFRVKNTKKKFLSYIVSNCRVAFREKAFTDLSNIATVHYGGRCSGLANGNGTIEESKVDGSWESNQHKGVFHDYRFGLVMENTMLDGYITEKMANAHFSGTVPIWYGTREVFNVFNERSFIFYDVDDPQPSLDRIIYLEKNQTAYDEILNEPILANGDQTIQDYFSFRDDVGGGKLKKRIRNMLGYE
jgi:hypothetical protein